MDSAEFQLFGVSSAQWPVALSASTLATESSGVPQRNIAGYSGVCSAAVVFG